METRTAQNFRATSAKFDNVNAMKKLFVVIAIFAISASETLFAQAAPKPPVRAANKAPSRPAAIASTRAAEIVYTGKLETLFSGLDASLAKLYVAWEKTTDNHKAVAKLGAMPIDAALIESLARAENEVRLQLRQMDAMPNPPLAFRRVSRDLETARQDVSRSIAIIDIWRSAPSDMMEKRAERLLRRGSSKLDDTIIDAKMIAARLAKTK